MDAYISLAFLFLAAVLACGGYIQVHVAQGTT